MSERRGKYNAKPTQADGYTFDSRAEERHYQTLSLLLKAGLIIDLVVHPRFEIVPKDANGRALYYEADFQYQDIDSGIVHVDDVKGVRTAVYQLKKRIFLARYRGYLFTEIGA